MSKDETERRVPNLRFKGFTDDWMQKKLLHVGKEQTGGGTPSTKIEEYWKGDIPWLQSSDIKKNEIFDIKPEKFITKNALGDSSAKLISGNSISIVTRVGVGKVGYITYDFATSQDFLSLHNLLIEPIFGTYAVHRLMKKLSVQTQGTSIKGITNKQLLNSEILIPKKIDEQKQIGKLLKSLETIITLEQEWCKSINLKKQFLIRNLFPSDDLKSHLRFEGYSTNWKIKKIKEIAEIHNKLRVPIKESLREPGKTPYYGANGIQGYVSGYTHKGEFTLIAEDGANDITNYPTIFVSGEIWVNNHAHVLTGKADILDTEFLTYYIQSMNIAKYLVGSGRWKLNAGILAEIPIVLPQLEEQIKIRNILKSIDKLIIKSKNKIEYYKNLKEILLKEMFI